MLNTVIKPLNYSNRLELLYGSIGVAIYLNSFHLHYLFPIVIILLSYDISTPFNINIRYRCDRLRLKHDIQNMVVTLPNNKMRVLK